MSASRASSTRKCAPLQPCCASVSTRTAVVRLRSFTRQKPEGKSFRTNLTACGLDVFVELYDFW